MVLPLVPVTPSSRQVARPGRRRPRRQARPSTARGDGTTYVGRPAASDRVGARRVGEAGRRRRPRRAASAKSAPCARATRQARRRGRRAAPPRESRVTPVTTGASRVRRRTARAPRPRSASRAPAASARLRGRALRSGPQGASGPGGSEHGGDTATRSARGEPAAGGAWCPSARPAGSPARRTRPAGRPGPALTPPPMADLRRLQRDGDDDAGLVGRGEADERQRVAAVAAARRVEPLRGAGLAADPVAGDRARAVRCRRRPGHRLQHRAHRVGGGGAQDPRSLRLRRLVHEPSAPVVDATSRGGIRTPSLAIVANTEAICTALTE